MNQVSSAQLAGWSKTQPLLEGDAGTEQTIARIRGLVDEALRDPLVRQTAGAIVARVRPYDELGEVRALYDWVHRNIRFTKDPYGKETLATARWILTHGFGDCDEINAILLPALLGAVGYPTRLVTIASNPTAPQVFSHVYAEVLVRGQWIPVDAARPTAAFGLAPRRFFRKRAWSLMKDFHQDVAGLGGDFLGVDWGQVIGAVGKTATGIITSLRIPKQYLGPPIPSTPAATYTPPPAPAIDATTILIGAALIGGALLLARKS